MAVFSACGENNEQPTGSTAGFDQSDLYLVIGGTKYYCDSDASVLISKLGENYKYSEAISCAYDGMDKIYIYENLEIYTYPDGAKDKVLELCVLGGDAETSKGIKTGAKAEDVKAAYGEGEDTGYLLTYELPAPNDQSEGASLYFTLDNGVVTAMSVTAARPIE